MRVPNSKPSMGFQLTRKYRQIQLNYCHQTRCHVGRTVVDPQRNEPVGVIKTA